LRNAIAGAMRDAPPRRQARRHYADDDEKQDCGTEDRWIARR
jgi:hypothetical protein